MVGKGKQIRFVLFWFNPNQSYPVNRASVERDINPFAPGDFAKKRVLKLVKWFSGPMSLTSLGNT